MFDITLYQYSPAWGLPNPSPFCMKLEGYLKLGGLDYQTVVQNDPRKAPKKKLPYVKIDKQVVADSEMIYEYLLSNQVLDLNARLAPELRPVHHALRVMCDESLYFTTLYNRWADNENWPILQQDLFAGLPKLIRGPVSNQIRKKVQGDLQAQGMGKHSAAEVYAIGNRHLTRLSEYLGDKTWFGGDDPVKLDVVVASHLANILKPPLQNPMKTSLQKMPNLLTFTDRALAEIYQVT